MIYHPFYSLLIRQESNYNSSARSPTGAIGLTQMVSTHWRQSCPGNLYDENTNINCGAISYRPIINLQAVGQKP